MFDKFAINKQIFSQVGLQSPMQVWF